MKESAVRVLVTGFQPFDGETTNPSMEAVKRLPETIENAEILKEEIPVVFSKAGIVLERLLEKYHPDLVLCIGQAGGDAVISVERVAINLMDARIPDNEGSQPVDLPVREDGPAAYFASLPVKSMVLNMQQGGIPAQLSFSAGSYVCNTLMYHLLYLREKKYPQMKGGFIHVPYAPQQAALKAPNVASMNIDDMTRGLQLAIEAAIRNNEASVAMGTLN
ncbi:MAG: pyroglutamyl-peptidase I [Anaerovoracaceae bacterium]